MAIIRCNKCALLQEQPDPLVGQSIPCPRCASPAPVYPTLLFIEKLLDKYFDAQRKLAGPGTAIAAAANAPATPTAPPQVAGNSLLALSACAPEVGSPRWCRNMKAKAKADSTASEAVDYTRQCILK